MDKDKPTGDLQELLRRRRKTLAQHMKQHSLSSQEDLADWCAAHGFSTPQLTVERTKATKTKKVLSKKRARDDEGQFVADDPATPENEAWVEEPPPETKEEPAVMRTKVSKKKRSSTGSTRM